MPSWSPAFFYQVPGATALHIVSQNQLQGMTASGYNASFLPLTTPSTQLVPQYGMCFLHWKHLDWTMDQKTSFRETPLLAGQGDLLGWSFAPLPLTKQSASGIFRAVDQPVSSVTNSTSYIALGKGSPFCSLTFQDPVACMFDYNSPYTCESFYEKQASSPNNK